MPTRPFDPAVAKLLGERIRRARTARGWSQERLAEKLGMDALTVSRLETARRILTAAMAIRLARALEVPVGSLLDDDPHAATEAEEEAALLLRGMDDERRAIALRVLRAVAG